MGLDERDIVYEKDTGFGNPFEVLYDRLATPCSMTSPVKRPGAAKRAVPRAAPGELDRRAGIQHPDEIFPAVPQQISCRLYVIQTVHKSRRRPVALKGHASGHGPKSRPVLSRCLQQHPHRFFAFSAQDAIDRAGGMTEELGRNKGRAMPSHTHQRGAEDRFRHFCEIDDFRNIREAITGERHDIRLPFPQDSHIGLLRFHL